MRQVKIWFLQTGDSEADKRRLKNILAKSRTSSGDDILAIEFMTRPNSKGVVVEFFEGFAISDDIIASWRNRGLEVQLSEIDQPVSREVTDKAEETKRAVDDF